VGVRFQQEFQLRAEAGDALLESRCFVDFFQGADFLFDALERCAHCHVKVARGFQKLFALGKGLASVAGHGQAGKKHARAVAQLLCQGGQISSALFAAQQCVNVARQLFTANVTDRKPEVTRSHVL
jgi:hypothetical protein